MTRGRLSLAVALLLAVAAAVVIRIARSEEPSASGGVARPSELTLLVVNTDDGPLTAVVGAGGSPAPAGLVLPGMIDITIPGQGDGTIDDAVQLPGRTAATAVANLLGVPIAHHVVVGQGKVAEVVDRAGGLEIGGTEMTGAEVVDSLLASEGAADAVWEATLEAILRTDLEAIRQVVSAAWGVPDREVLPLIVLNGSGVPGIGELVAERLIPGGFRVVVSENASSFDHETTLVVIPSEEHRPLGERVRDLLGVGEVQVAGPASGLADVTIVVGKDFGA